MTGIVVMICISGAFALPFIIEAFQSYLIYKQNSKQLEIKRLQEARLLEDKKIQSAKEIRLSKNVIDLEKLMDD